jgi:hypothetical protein
MLVFEFLQRSTVKDVMDILKEAHSCLHCQKIVIDGTLHGPWVNQSYRYSFEDVKRFAEEFCVLFRWSLQWQLSTDLEPTDQLLLYIATNTRDLSYLNARSKSADGERREVHEDDINHSRLHIFTEEGMSQYYAWRAID